MEARDSGPKIRPLPVDDLDVDAPQQTPVEPKRRWVPLVVIVAGAIAFGVIATGLGPGEPDSVGGRTTTPPATIGDEPPPTTTTLPQPPALREFLPFADDGLKLVSLSATTAGVGGWDADAAHPVFHTNITRPQTAAFNVDGTRVAVAMSTSRGSAFVIDEAAGGNPTYVRGATSGRWHPTDPSLFAWSEPDDDAGMRTVIRVGDLSGDTSAGLTALVDFTLEGEHLLRAWGDWGFATETAGVTFVFDPDGMATYIAEGTFLSASADGVLLLGMTEADSSVPSLLHPDGSLVAMPSLDVGASEYHITADAEWVLAVTLQADGHTSILAKAVNSRSTRLTSIEHAARIVGSMADDRALILQEIDSNDLVFKDWSSGAEFRLPVDSEIGAVYVVDPHL